jgi:hypothetical protein
VRSYPHKPDEDQIKKFLENDRQDYDSGRLKADDAATRRSEAFFRRQSELAAEVAAMEYAFEGKWSDIRTWLESSGADARKATEFGLGLNPVLYMTYLALAILWPDREFRKELEGFPRSRFTNKNVKADEIFYLAAEAMRDISVGKLDTASEAAAAGLDRLKAKDGPNPYAKDAMEAILLLLDAIAHKDNAKLKAATMARSKKYDSSYSKAAARNFPSGLLDVTGLGLLKLARENELNAGVESVYLPSELLSAENT